MKFWLKLMHGAPANPKWRMIAQKCGVPQGEVWTLYSWALDFAGQHAGSLAGFDLEEVAATTDYLLDDLKRIWAAFVDKAIVTGEAIRNWVEHQGAAAVAAVKAKASHAERTRRYRERQAATAAATAETARQGSLFGDDVTPSRVTAPVTGFSKPLKSAAPVTPRYRSDVDIDIEAGGSRGRATPQRAFVYPISGSRRDSREARSAAMFAAVAAKMTALGY